ncbi:MAG: hypothetical protein QW112_02600 [Candidatus Micrarchaeia archaeon]
MEMRRRIGIKQLIRQTISERGPGFVLQRLECEGEVTGRMRDQIGNQDFTHDPVFQMSYNTGWVTRMIEETVRAATRIARQRGSEFVRAALQTENRI